MFEITRFADDVIQDVNENARLQQSQQQPLETGCQLETSKQTKAYEAPIFNDDEFLGSEVKEKLNATEERIERILGDLGINAG